MTDAELDGKLYLALLLLQAGRGFRNWDDFGEWYRTEESERETNRAAYFYRDKIPLDGITDELSPSWVTDCGEGAERIYGAIVSTRQRKLSIAKQRLKRNHKHHLIRTLELISENGNNRRESVLQLMREKRNRLDWASAYECYRLNRRRLLRFFKAK